LDIFYDSASDILSPLFNLHIRFGKKDERSSSGYLREFVRHIMGMLEGEIVGWIVVIVVILILAGFILFQFGSESPLRETFLNLL